MAKAEALLAAAELTVRSRRTCAKSGAVPSDVKVRQARQQRDVAAAEVASAKAKLAKAKTAADVRVRQAEAATAAAEADLRQPARAKVEEADQDAADAAVEVQKAELELARTRIVAPIDGVVMELNVRAGHGGGRRGPAAGAQGVVVTLYDPKKLQVRVEVPVAKFQLVRHGQPAEVEVEDVLPGEELHRHRPLRHAPGERHPQQRAGEGRAAGRPAGATAAGDDRQRPVPRPAVEGQPEGRDRSAGSSSRGGCW